MNCLKTFEGINQNLMLIEGNRLKRSLSEAVEHDFEVARGDREERAKGAKKTGLLQVFFLPYTGYR